MAVNPQLLNALANPAQIKLNDPMEQYGAMLQNALISDKLMSGRAERESKNALRKVLKASVRPDGSYDEGQIRYGAAQADAGDVIPDLDEWFNKNKKYKSEIDENTAKTVKTKADAVGQAFKNANERMKGISTTNLKQGVLDLIQFWDEQAVDPVISPWLSDRGVDPKEARDRNLAQLEAVLATKDPTKFHDYVMNLRLEADDTAKKHFQLIDEGDKGQKLVQVSQIGGTPEVIGNYAPAPHKGTSVTVNTGDKGPTELEKKVGQGLGDDFLEAKRTAAMAPQRIAEIDRAINTVDKGNAILGAGSQAMLDVVRAAKALGMKVNDDALVDTEQLSRFFAQNTLGNVARFKQMGMALTPMSDSDRALIERASVQGTNDPATIKRLLLIQRKMEQESILKYNELAQQYLGNKATSKGMTNMSIGTMDPVADRPSSVSIPPAAIEYLRKNPGLARAFEEKYGLPPGSAAQYIGGR